MSGPTMYASITRKFNLGNFESREVTVGISQVPLAATDAVIAEMLSTGGRLVDALDKQIEFQFNSGPAPEIAHEKPSVHSPNLEPTVFVEPVPAPVAVTAGIPDEADVVTHTRTAFGVEVTMPPDPWFRQPVEATDPVTLRQSKVMRHLNAALTSAGFAGDQRHGAALAIISESKASGRTVLASLKDLTRGESQIVIDWLNSAGAVEIEALRLHLAVVGSGSGSGHTELECCDLFPFCDCEGAPARWKQFKETTHV